MDVEDLEKAQNTFLLALDGDVDFKPNAVTLLVDRMKKNPKTGAACGRIHPIGQGAVVWYQVFEYAIGHWFQKATEHVFGCVLCSPGCFSLFRGSALLDDNVMKRYTTEPTEPIHYVQYDQGEDRWLCTLLLQQGYRVDYTAASDALTYAPEEFKEFFNQRRRWMPSTLANVVDLLGSTKQTVVNNPNLSNLYMLYQFGLLISTVLGPSTIVVAIASAYRSILPSWPLWGVFLLSLAPCVFYIAICFICKPDIQIYIAAGLSAIYACVMLVVLVSVFRSFIDEDLLDPSLMFIVIIACSFVLGGIFHPQEIMCLPPGILYYLCVPAGYMILVIYSLTNLNVISWGTREVPRLKTAEELEEERQIVEENNNKKSWFAFLSFDTIIKEMTSLIRSLFKATETQAEDESLLMALKVLHKDMRKMTRAVKVANGLEKLDSSEDEDDTVFDRIPAKEKSKTDAEKTLEEKKEEDEKHKASIISQNIVIPAKEEWLDQFWIKDTDRIGNGDIKKLSISEIDFWERFLKKYLLPIPKNRRKEAEVTTKLAELRNNIAFGFWFANLLWVLLNYLLMSDQKLYISVFGARVQGLGLIFMVLFTFILIIQLIGMFVHRWGTFTQLIAITQITWPWDIYVQKYFEKHQNTQKPKLNMKDAIEFVRKLGRKPAQKNLNNTQPNENIFDKWHREGRNQLESKLKEKTTRKRLFKNIDDEREHKLKQFANSYGPDHNKKNSEILMEMSNDRQRENFDRLKCLAKMKSNDYRNHYDNYYMRNFQQNLDVFMRKNGDSGASGDVGRVEFKHARAFRGQQDASVNMNYMRYQDD